MITLFCLPIHCSWTPEVTTLIHENVEGHIALQTSSSFHILPQHPQELSISLLKHILVGIKQHQEQGILQEIFLADSEQHPLFTPDQIAFLAPQLVEAFSLATSEELVIFDIPEKEKGTTRLQGTMVLFSPNIFLLTLDNTAPSTKMTTSSRHLRTLTLLTFTEKQAMLTTEEAQGLIKISPKRSWVAINYAAITPSILKNRERQNISTDSVEPHQPQKSQPKLNILQEQVQDLRKQINRQAEEIQRLQLTSPE